MHALNAFATTGTSPTAREPMTAELLPPATRFIHIFPQTLKEALAKGTTPPVVAVRPAENPAQYALYHGVEILGPSRLFREATPLPDTEGRGVAYIITDAPIRAYLAEEVAR